MNVLPVEHLTYSTGPRGSRRLRRAAAALLNQQFHSRSPVTYDNILVTPGLASAIDGIVFSICDECDGILIPQPLYNGFRFDMLNRSNVQVTGVRYEGIEGFQGLDDLFKPEVNRKALENALLEARKAGIQIKALLISKLVSVFKVFQPKGIPGHADVQPSLAHTTLSEDAMCGLFPLIISLLLYLHSILAPRDATRICFLLWKAQSTPHLRRDLRIFCLPKPRGSNAG